MSDDLTYYPGSRTPVRDYGDRRTARAVQFNPDAPLELGQGKAFKIRGKDVELFTIGSLAQALNRTPGAIRALEKEGMLPSSGLKEPGNRGYGQRRLYSRDQIESAVKIAYEEGILFETWRSVRGTKFRDRVAQSWREWKESL